jgi:hypothetical protein
MRDEALGEDLILKTEPSTRSTRQNRTFPRGRSCARPGCSTRLSIYNPRSVCWQHEEPRPASPVISRPHRFDARSA